jgi:DNA-binding IclR family transcriptional regulator
MERNFQNTKVPQHVVGSATKVLAALRLLCEADDPLTLSALTDKLQTSESTAYRVLQTLVQCRFAQPVGKAGGYAPSMEIVRLGGLIASRDPLSAACEEVLTPISHRFDEPITVCVLDRDRVLFVSKLSGPRAPRFYCDVGRTLPLHKGAAARCLLAHLDERLFEAYIDGLSLRGPDAGAGSSADLRCDRAEIRRLGYAISAGDVDVGISAVGVPIKGADNRVVCAAAIANVTARWNDEEIALRAKVMLSAAESIRLHNSSRVDPLSSADRW